MTGYLSVKEAADRLGVVDSRIRQLILAGQIEAEKVGKLSIIPTSEITRLRRQRTAKKAKRKAVRV